MTSEKSQRPTSPPRQWRVRRIFSLVVMLILLIATSAVLFQVGLWRAQVAIEARHHRQALNWLTGISWIWPRNAEWYYLSARANRREENFDLVHEHLQTAFNMGWPVADLEYEQVLAQTQSGQYDQVTWSQLFQNAGSDGPEICSAYVNASLARFRLDSAASVLKSWKADFPDDPEPIFIEGRIMMVLQRWQEAEQLFSKVLEKDPKHFEARADLAEAYMKQLKYEPAVTELRRLIQQKQSPDLQAELAHCLIQQGQAEDAKSLLENELRNHPEHLGLMAEMGRLLSNLGQHAQAIPYLEKVVQAHPEETEIRYALAQALRAEGQEEQAASHFKFVDQATKALQELSRLTSKVVENPDEVETRFEVAEITWKWKSREEGEAWLKSVLEFAPNHKATHELLAQHYFLKGETKQADFHKSMAERESIP